MLAVIPLEPNGALACALLAIVSATVLAQHFLVLAVLAVKATFALARPGFALCRLSCSFAVKRSRSRADAVIAASPSLATEHHIAVRTGKASFALTDLLRSRRIQDAVATCNIARDAVKYWFGQN